MTWRGNFEGGRGPVEDMPDMCGGRYTQSDSALTASVQFGCRYVWCTAHWRNLANTTEPFRERRWCGLVSNFSDHLLNFQCFHWTKYISFDWPMRKAWYLTCFCRLACLHSLCYGVLVWLSTDRFSDWFNFYTVSQKRVSPNHQR